MTSRITFGCQTISLLQKLLAIVYVTSEVAADSALFPAIDHAGAVGTMDAAAVRIVAVFAATFQEIFGQSDDAQFRVVDRSGLFMQPSDSA